jgi:mannose-1-phosphate guanylyltransferase
VRSFIEKPPEHIARGLYRSGALWNTMVLVGRVSRLAGLYEEHLPEIAVAFRRYRQLTPAGRFRSLRDIYDGLTAADFSRDILQPAEGLAVCALPRGTGWSDLGTPARLDEWLAQMAQAEAV